MAATVDAKDRRSMAAVLQLTALLITAYWLAWLAGHSLYVLRWAWTI